MAEAKKSEAAKPAAPAKKSEAKTHFYKSRLAGLSVVVDNDRDNQDPTTALEQVRFVPYEEKFQGDIVRTGYLKTSDPRAVKILATDSNVEEISEDEFKQATDTERDKNPAKRVAY